MGKSLAEKWADHSSVFLTPNEPLQSILHVSFRICNKFAIQDFAATVLIADKKYVEQKYTSYLRKYFHVFYILCLSPGPDMKD